tara:strand:+ start:11098 stop:12933 length:1836 start_codon:yes stop_codon:yes gene_type:complete
LDKGFNVKFIYRPKLENLPNIAIGIDDFAGSGFFSREYLVTTQDYKDIKLTFGIGWGKLAAQNSFKNPLSFISDKLIFRPNIINLAGSPSYNEWFRGNASYFGGLEYHLPNSRGIKLKIEHDPFDYFDFSANNRFDAIYDLRKKESKINYGLSFPVNDFITIDASFVKGNTFNFNFNFGFEFSKNNIAKKRKFEPNIKKINTSSTNSKNAFYLDLLSNLNNNNLFLQTADLRSNGDLDITISSTNHRNTIRSSSYASYISKKVADLNDIDLRTINVSHINAGIALNEVTYLPSFFDEKKFNPVELAIRNTKINAGNSDKLKSSEFKPKVSFPVVFNTIKPTILSHVGYPAKFFYGGINLQLINETQFNRNLILSTEINQPIYSNFDETVSKPDSFMETVRTRLVKYLQEDDINIGRMQIDYIWSPFEDVYTKISGGIFESMFGGYGAEILYKPHNKKFYVGAEIFKVKQRAFDQRFSFQNYTSSTGHINLGYKLPIGIEANLSFGRYLAKDDGYTLDLARRTNSGFLAGIYFTRTNVSARIFGEGSFDKGFYFQFPLDFFSREYTSQNTTFKLSPLTRDGGAKLIHAKDLKGLINNSTLYEINDQWDGFLN